MGILIIEAAGWVGKSFVAAAKLPKSSSSNEGSCFDLTSSKAFVFVLSPSVYIMLKAAYLSFGSAIVSISLLFASCAIMDVGVDVADAAEEDISLKAAYLSTGSARELFVASDAVVVVVGEVVVDCNGGDVEAEEDISPNAAYLSFGSTEELFESRATVGEMVEADDVRGGDADVDEGTSVNAAYLSIVVVVSVDVGEAAMGVGTKVGFEGAAANSVNSPSAATKFELVSGPLNSPKSLEVKSPKSSASELPLCAEKLPVVIKSCVCGGNCSWDCVW